MSYSVVKAAQGIASSAQGEPISQHGHRRHIKIVVPPFMSIFRPSLGASLLKANLQQRGIPCEVCYVNMDFSKEAGHHLTQYIAKHSGKSLLVGEWIFSHALYPERDADKDKEYLNLLSSRLPSDLIKMVMAGANQASEFVSTAAKRLLVDKPAIIGFSSMFQTHAAALALAAAVKQISPDTITCFGGANCEGPMGRATVDSFPQVDYVFSGDADETFPEFVRRCFAGEEPLAYAPSIFTRQGEHKERPPTNDDFRLGSNLATNDCKSDASASGIFGDLDSIPPPAYEEYFEKVDELGIAGEFTVGLLVETSRGCWWGEKSHCRFCGLNGFGMKYRSKSPARIIQEFEFLTDRWNPDFLQVTDNILDIKHLPAFDELRRSERTIRLYYEVKSNMTEDQLRRIALGGVAWVQAGVESLNDAVLTLMGKGVTALQNVRLLRNCIELGIVPHWNILSGFPSERPEQYARMAEMVEYLEHLPPPVGSNPIRLVRFSPYYERASEFGYVNVRAAPAYRYIYDVRQDQLEKLAYLFVADNDEVPGEKAISELPMAIERWQRRYGRGETYPKLMWFELNGAHLIKDTRSIAKQKWTSIGKTGLAVLNAFRNPGVIDTVLGQLENTLGSRADVRTAWKLLVEHKFILIDDNRALSLVVDPRKRVRPAAGTASRANCLGEKIEQEIAHLLHGPDGNERDYHLQFAPTAKNRAEELT
jgi:ribosomal peptide maturation radical SAM protein 1